MITPEPPADACGDVTTGIGGKPIGPCVKTGKHTVHANGRGCTWWMAPADVVPDTGQALRERLREVLGHDELPDDAGLVADIAEWVRLARAFGAPVPAGYQEPEFTRADIARVTDEWDLTADRIESHGQDDPDRERIRSGIYRACAQTMRHLVHMPSGDTVQAPADLAYARSEVDKWLNDGDPYCILPTRTEHIPALLARLDELEGTS